MRERLLLLVMNQHLEKHFQKENLQNQENLDFAQLPGRSVFY